MALPEGCKATIVVPLLVVRDDDGMSVTEPTAETSSVALLLTVMGPAETGKEPAAPNTRLPPLTVVALL